MPANGRSPSVPIFPGARLIGLEFHKTLRLLNAADLTNHNVIIHAKPKHYFAFIGKYLA